MPNPTPSPICLVLEGGLLSAAVLGIGVSAWLVVMRAAELLELIMWEFVILELLLLELVMLEDGDVLVGRLVAVSTAALVMLK